jgi:TolB-like protein
VLARYGGRLVKLTGDGALVEFASAVDALGAAIEFQQAMAEANQDQPEDARIVFRIGLHVGDLIVEGDDLYGDGVNVAARLEAEAPAGGILVSRTVHEAVSGRLKATFDDLGSLALKNIERPVQAFRVKWDATDWKVSATVPPAPLVGPAALVADAPLTLPDKPSIAVLPFQNMSGDPEQEYFVDGLVEDIITALSRIRWLFVIARNSSFTYKGQAVDVKRVGRELGVRYVLEGSVRKAGTKLRISGQLIDTLTGAHLWADRFDGLMEDVFDLQDKIAISVAGVIEPALEAAEISRTAERRVSDFTAYDLYLRALPHAFTWEKSRILQALDLLAQAVKRDVHYGPALVLAAFCHQELDINDWVDDAEANRQCGIALARRGLQVAGEHAGVLAAGAFVLGFFGEEIDAVVPLIDRALALNPSFARGWNMSGWARLWLGQPDIAIEHYQTALRLNPRDRKAFPPNGIGIAHFFNRRFDDAIGSLLTMVQENPNWATPYRFLAASYGHVGRVEEARNIVARLRAITPMIVPNRVFAFRNPQHRELYLSGLRLAVGESA